MDINLVSMTEDHWEKVSEIYKEGIATGNATFETNVPKYTDWDKNHVKNCRLVAKIDTEVVGWAALTNVSSRCIYSGVAEVSVYVSKLYFGRKIGTALLNRLIEKSEENGIWTLQSGIFPENIASIKIHEKLGFRTVGYREKIGRMDGVWRDTVILERRSKLVGI